MLRVGITGGIGSGKTTVCSVFEWLGVQVYYADLATKSLYNTNASLKSNIIDAFGSDVYPKGEFDRKVLAQKVFGDAVELNRLNHIVHPYVFDDYETWCQNHQNEPYTLKEAAIIFESGSYLQLHKVIGVFAPEELRISRVINREKIEKSAVVERIAKQMDQNKLRNLCDYFIDNDGEHSLMKQVVNTHIKLMKTADSKNPPSLKSQISF